MGIHHLNRAGNRLVGVRIDKGVHPASHRVTLYALVTPALKVIGDIFCGEIIPVIPLHAFSDLQGILGRICVNFPAFQQLALDCAIAVILNQIFQPATCEIGNL